MMSVPVLSAVFHAWHCDHYGHVNVRHYSAVFDDAIFAFWTQLGVPKTGIVPVTAQITTTFQSEASAGDVVSVTANLERLGGKSATIRLVMTDIHGAPRATCDVVEVFFDTNARSSAPMPDNIRSALAAMN